MYHGGNPGLQIAACSPQASVLYTPCMARNPRALLRSLIDPQLFRRFRLAAGVLLSVLVFGTAGYMVIERWSFLDALYMTVITVATVGYGEVHPLGPGGRVLTIALIFVGVGAVGYGASTLIELVIEHRFFDDIIKGRVMANEIEQLRDHFIVCGFGRVGEEVAATLTQSEKQFVVIEQDTEIAAQCREAGYRVVLGDATHDATLLHAGLDRAKGVVAALGGDAANLFVTLSCRDLNDALYIVSRVSDGTAEAKFRRAGADRTLSAASIVGRRLASMVSEPNVVDVVDMIVAPDFAHMGMEEVKITENSPLAGRTVGDRVIRTETGAQVIAINQGEGLVANPSPDIAIAPGDIVVAFGTRDHLARFLALADGSDAAGNGAAS